MRRRDFLRIQSLLAFGHYSAVAQGVAAGQTDEYDGMLEDELVPEFSFMSSHDLPQVLDHPRGSAIVFPSDAALFGGELPFLEKTDPFRVLLVESATDGAQLWVDLNRDGQLTKDEAFRFRPVPQRPKAIGDVVLKVAHLDGPFRSFPIRLRLFHNADQPGGPTETGKRTIFYSFYAYVTGTVRIGPSQSELRVWCAYDSASGKVDPLHGRVGMDLNGDGVLEGRALSAEQGLAKGEEVVFDVGGEYLSIHRVDVANRTVVLRSHPKADFLRVELKVGAIFPDFEFTDFEGHKHTLSNIEGKYVLLDFWGSWCGPCLGEFPSLKRAYEAFRTRGFQILGIDANEPAANAHECIVKNSLPWLQATSESTATLVEKKLNITLYPTLILLDHERRIVSVDSDGHKLRGDDLLRTLDMLWSPR